MGGRRERGELEPRGGGRSAVQLCFPEPGISLCLTDMWTKWEEKYGEKKGEEEKRNEGVSVMTVEVTKARTDSKKKKKRRAGLSVEVLGERRWRWFRIQD